MLELHGASAGYGKLIALRELTMRVDRGEIVALLGANGAGKSTTLRLISGVLRPVAGRVTFEDEDIGAQRPDAIVRRGVVQVPEGRQVFATLSVLENLKVGGFASGAGSVLADDLARVYDLFPVLAERGSQAAGTLSGGEQQMLAIGRGLMANPRFLMLDEPSLGLAPIVVERIFDAIAEINDQGTTLLIVEQNARIAMDIADRAYVLAAGRLMLEGDAEELEAMPSVGDIYLGKTPPLNHQAGRVST